jgi:hypothetical protein
MLAITHEPSNGHDQRESDMMPVIRIERDDEQLQHSNTDLPYATEV